MTQKTMGDDLTTGEAASARDMRDRIEGKLRADAIWLRWRAAHEPDALDSNICMDQARMLDALADQIARLEPVEQPEPVRSRDFYHDVTSLRDDVTGLHVRGG